MHSTVRHISRIQILVLAGLLLSTLPAHAQVNASPQDDISNPPVCSGAHECVKSLSLYLGRDVPVQAAPWAVFQLFAGDALSTHQKEGVYAKGLSSLRTGSQFSDPKAAQAYIQLLRQKAVGYSTRALTDAGVPAEIAEHISTRMTRPYLVSLEKAMLANALQTQGQVQRQLQDGLHKACAHSLDPLLKDRLDQKAFVSDIAGDVIRSAPKLQTLNSAMASRIIFVTLNTGQGAPSNMDDLAKVQSDVDNIVDWTPHAKVAGLKEKVLSYMKPEVAAIFNASKEDVQNQALDAIANEVVLRARDPNAFSKNPQAIAVVNANAALKVLSQIGNFQDIERQSAAKIITGGIDVTNSLGKLHGLVTDNWDSLYQSVATASGKEGIPPELIKATEVVHVVNDFSRLLQGGFDNATLPSDMVEGLAAIAKQGGDTKTLDLLVSGYKAITDGKASAFDTGGAVLTSLARAVPALAPLSDAFNKFAPIMKAAGPLLALSSFASPLGFVQLAGMFGGGGGLFGGGHDDSEQLAQINQALIQISAQLNTISKQLDALQKQIQENQIQIMDALESISYDVNRLHDLLLTDLLGKTFGSCQKFQNDVAKGRKLFTWSENPDSRDLNSPLSHVIACDTGLTDFMATDQGHTLRLAIYNVPTASVSRDNALDKLKAAANTFEHSPSAKDACLNLMLGAMSLHDVDNPPAIPPSTPDQKSLCRTILNVNEMLDPVVFSYMISVEADISSESTRFGIEAATKEFWTNSQRKQLLGRWSDELKELNVAIAQHALLGGDATLADWGTKLYDPANLSEDETKLLKGNQILAANAARYWLWHELPKQKEDKPSPVSIPDVGGQAIYSFSYHACDPEFMTLATRKAESFFQTTDAVTYQLKDGNVVEQDKDKPRGPCPTTDSGKNQSSSRWCANFAKIGCVDLPTPIEYSTHELRRSSSLESLLQARDSLLMLIETTMMTAELLNAGDKAANAQQRAEARRLQFFEAMAIQWKFEHPTVAAARKLPGAKSASNPEVILSLRREMSD
jgi:hypothetical protein